VNTRQDLTNHQVTLEIGCIELYHAPWWITGACFIAGKDAPSKLGGINVNTKKLKQLRRELAAAGNLLEVEAPVGLVLNDVCGALELTNKERREVLGPQLERELEYFLDIRIGKKA
jgi:hypothetical protein